MAIIIKTNNGAAIVQAIKKAIDNKEIETWSYDKDGDFTHTAKQWINKAWFRPRLYQGELRFGLLGQKGVDMKKIVYSIYHGHFVEMLLTHFDDQFAVVQTTSQITEPDSFET